MRTTPLWFVVLAACGTGAGGGGDDNSLVAYYPFDGNANDQSGSLIDGILHGATPTADRFGNPNGALSFETGAAYVGMGKNARLPVGAAPRTLAAWIRASGASAGFETVMNWGTALTDQRCGLSLEDGWPLFTAQYDDVTSTGTLTDGGWHHIAATYDGATLVLYVDGGPAGQGPIALDTVGQSMFVGKKLDPATEYFAGDLDEIRVYNRALEAAEIASLYHQGGW